MVLQRQINATDRQIDSLIYELCGLAEEEIKIVEGSSADPPADASAESTGQSDVRPDRKEAP